MTMQLHLQQVPARNGRLWIRHGFKVFQRQPLALAGLFGLFLFAGFAVMLIPGVGLVLTMASLPLLSLGFMLATHLVLQKKVPTVSVFVAPLKLTPERRRSQLLLCFAYAGAMLTVGLLADWVDGGSTRDLQKLIADNADNEAIANAATDPRLFWGLATRLGLMGLLSVPYWHAPALVHWGGQGVAQALFSSTLALWRNKGAFLVNMLLWGGLLMAVASCVSLVFGLLGLAQFAPMVLMAIGLMLSTVFYASLYFSFVDCFMFGAPQDVLND
ncbi:BPSS1780 family membrane protein [Pelomonas sp. Root662]|uniref:BPSS1780 family membrane protein n=2 Tax=unclassified Roseateles TaxID=2626991 RepID=UPI000AAD83BA|nr:BPSS1780 family membrane protein [Pelomonas sp. Root662]